MVVARSRWALFFGRHSTANYSDGTALFALILCLIGVACSAYGTVSIYNDISQQSEKDSTWPQWFTLIISLVVAILSSGNFHSLEDVYTIPYLHFLTIFFSFHSLVVLTGNVSTCCHNEPQSRFDCYKVYTG
eukprot:Sdes_comp11721_c0_seq2m2823